MSERANALVKIITSPDGAPALQLRCLVPIPLRRGVPGAIYIYAAGGVPPYAYAIVAGALPAGMGPILPGGNVIGTPTATGRFEFLVEAQDSAAVVVQQRFAVEVAGRLLPLAVAPVIGEVTLPYSYQMRVSGATGAVTWSLLNGNLPAGLTLASATGIISGTPTAAGVGRSYATLRASDSGSGDTLDCAVMIEIAAELTWCSREGTPGSGNVQVLPPYILGRQTQHPIAGLWTGGVGPYTVLPDEEAAILPLNGNVWPVGGGAVRTRAQAGSSAGNWYYRATASGQPVWPDASPGRFWVRDALGKVAAIIFGAAAISESGAFVASRQGGAVIGGVPAIDFSGAAVAAVELTDEGGIRVTIAVPSDAGWGAVAGISSKGAWTIYISPGTIANTYSATVASQLTAALAHIQVLSQRVAALQGALTTAGILKP